MRLGLRTKLLGVSIGLLVVVTGAALGVVYHYVGRQVREQTAKRLHAGAHALTAVFERTQEQLLGRGRILVELPSLHTALTTGAEGLEPLLQEVKSVRAANLLWATDAAGTVLASTGEYPPPGTALAGHPVVHQALEGQTAMGFDVFVDEWWLLLSLPVRPQGSERPLGTVTLALLLGQAYVARLSELIGTEVGFLWHRRPFWSDGWPQASRFQLAAQAFTVPIGELQELATPAGRFLWRSQPVAVGLHPAITRTTALLGAPIDESVIYRTARAIGWVAGIALLLGVIALTSAIRSITRPLRRLVQDSQRVGAGDLDHRAAVEGSGEVAELARSFNQMVGNLRQSRDALVEAKRYSDSVISHTINSLVVADADGVIRIVNPATLELLGYAEAELIGRHLITLLPGDDSPVTGTRWQIFLHRGVIRNLETTYRTKHGRAVPVLFSSAVMRSDDGEVQGIVCVAQDISERKQLENIKDSFIRIASHELRTPLTPIQETLALLREGTLGPINAEQQQFIDIAYGEAQRLGRLSQTMLDLSIIDSGRMTLDRERFDVLPLLDQAWKAHQAARGARQLVRRVDGPSTVYADRSRVLQIVGHLLGNAIQFTRDSGLITVAVTPRDGWVTIAVTDNGGGIPPEEARQLFQKFSQPGRIEEERSGGTGLGLVLCRKLVELHGGTMNVTSELGQGSTFTFTLPMTA